MKRRFNQAQKIALYFAANGQCSICGAPLESGWHADHVEPYVKGGETDVINGQALCASCNLKKGKRSTMLPVWPDSKKLRSWQEEAYNKYQQHTERDFLLVATPGAGKTNFALRVAHYLLQSGQVSQVIVVCPTDHLKGQWTKKAAEVGIQLERNFSLANVVVRPGFHGIATTYQQVSGNPQIFRAICRKSTFVIFDEIHHAGELLAWGDGLRTAFDPAFRRLSLSGTPFRGDNRKIPFVYYGSDGRSNWNHNYGYADSLRDEVCRYVFFPKYEGQMVWISNRTGDVQSAKFEDELDEYAASERLNTAISIDGEWIGQVLRDANERLMELRAAGHRNAGGLVIAKDQFHAQAIVDLLYEKTGEKPTLAISDVPDASSRIEQFSESSKCWIVAVKMVSEGVDIPRLRVLVYATNIATEMFFRQAVGRIIRVIPNLEEQNAYFYIPNDNTLVQYAQEIKKEREHQIDQEQFDDGEDEYEDRGERKRIPSSFRPISAEAERDGAVFDQSLYSQDEINTAIQIGKQSGYPQMMPEAIAYYIRFGQQMATPASGTAPTGSKPSTGQPSLFEQIEKARKSVNKLVNYYAGVTGIKHQDVHIQWMREYNGTPQAKAGLDELKRKHQWLEKLIKGLDKP